MLKLKGKTVHDDLDGGDDDFFQQTAKIDTVLVPKIDMWTWQNFFQERRFCIMKVKCIWLTRMVCQSLFQSQREMPQL